MDQPETQKPQTNKSQVVYLSYESTQFTNSPSLAIDPKQPNPITRPPYPAQIHQNWKSLNSQKELKKKNQPQFYHSKTDPAKLPLKIMGVFSHLLHTIVHCESLTLLIMSGLLDQAMVEDIARHCPGEFLAFHKCMAKPPSEADCVAEQMALTKCVKSKVPLFQQIQSTCAGKLQAYEACLKLNGGNQKKCQTDLQSLRDCASKVVGK